MRAGDKSEGKTFETLDSVDIAILDKSLNMLCCYTASRECNTDVDKNDGVTQRYVRVRVRDRVVIYTLCR